MNSIQSRLTLRLGLAMVVLSVVAGGGLFAYLRHGMRQEFDHALLTQAYGLEPIVTEHVHGGYDVDIDPARLPGYGDEHMTEYFCITDKAGAVVVRSTREPIAFTGPAGLNAPVDAVLPNGEPVRAVRLAFIPQIEVVDRARNPRVPIPAHRDALTVLAVRSRRPLDRQIASTALAVTGAVAALSLAAFAATLLTVRSGLGTLRKVASDLANADPAQRDVGFDADAVPTELRPVVLRFNSMLARVAETLTRERRFSADVAHELRTPIAELRSAAEVALRAPEDNALSLRCAVQAGEIARQMQTIVTTLLAIVRQEISQATVALTPVSLADAIHAAALQRDPAAARVRVVSAPGDERPVLADAALLRGVLSNVIGNAVAHGCGVVSVDVRDRGDTTELTVENAHHGLTAADLPHLFAPFWRKDRSRSDGEHVGLGLTLTRAYCKVMNVAANVTLPAPERFRITLVFRNAAFGPRPQRTADAVQSPADLEPVGSAQ